MIILVIAERDVTNFSYITGNPLDRDWIFLSGLGRYLREDSSHQIVSIQDIPVKDITGPVRMVYLEGHGAPGSIGVTDHFPAVSIVGQKGVREYISEAFGTEPTTVNSIEQVFITSCRAAEKRRMVGLSGIEAVSVVDGVAQAFESVRLANSMIVTKTPIVRGCRGFALLHPDQKWPIVQVNPDHEKECIALQSSLEEKYHDNIQRANRFIKDMLEASKLSSAAGLLRESSSESLHEDRIRLLRDTAEQVARLTTTFYSELISQAYEKGYLLTQGFTLAGEVELTGFDRRREMPILFREVTVVPPSQPHSPPS